MEQEKNYNENRRKLFIYDFEKLDNIKLEKKKLDKITTNSVNKS